MIVGLAMIAAAAALDRARGQNLGDFDWNLPWKKMPPEQLREHARAEGAGWARGYLDADAYDWTYVPALPLRTLQAIMSPAAWREWYADERHGRPAYFRDLEKAWAKSPVAVGPVVIAQTADGAWDVGDGWHRLGVAFVQNRRTVPAIVGKPRRVTE